MHQNLDEFYDHLIVEVETNCDGLSDEQYRSLRSYYEKLHNNEPLRPFYRYNWMRRVEPLLWAIDQCPPRTTPLRLLDAGCGPGTESLLVGTSRNLVEVTGVDINGVRLATAHQRLDAYQRHLGRTIMASFQDTNVFSLLKDRQFEIIWAMEALSHIDPAEHFLVASAESVGPGGYLVISDSHLANPAMLWRLYKMHGLSTAERTTFVLAEDEVVSVADERLFFIGHLKRMLSATGWQPVRTQLSIFFPPRTAKHESLFELVTKMDRAMNRIPLLRYLGGIYTVVAQRRAD